MHTQKTYKFKNIYPFHSLGYISQILISIVKYVLKLTFCYGKSHLDLKIVVDVMCNCCAMCSILRKSVSLYDLGM